MTSLSLSYSQTLLAEAVTDTADTDTARTVAGILVPWGEPGRTNLGRGVSVRRGALHLEADARVIGLVGHNREAPVSRLIDWQDRPEGLWGRLRIAETPAGDQLLAELRAGIRDGLSVEVEVHTQDGLEITSGRLDYVAHVPLGAFDSARVHTLAATVTPTGEPVTSPTAPAAPVAIDYAELAAALAPAMAGAMATALQPVLAAQATPAAPSAAALLGTGNVPTPGAPAQLGGGADPLAEAIRLQAAVASGDYTLLAALQDITHSSLDMFRRPAGTIGEKLWEGGTTQRRWVALMDSGELTSMKGTSWQWTRGPEVAAWSGDKTQVPTNPVTLEEVPWTARRCAGGWDIDRAFRDFGTTEFWAEFYAEQVESYLELSDQWAAEALISYARDITAEGMVPEAYGTVEAVEAGPTQILKAAALGTAILEDTPKVRTGPDWIAVNTLDWLTLADLTALDLPAFLALLKVNPANFMRSMDVPRGEVILGVKKAAKFRELGGAAPIRVEALDVARGGIDSAVYGYCGYEHRRPGGIISVPLAPAA